MADDNSCPENCVKLASTPMPNTTPTARPATEMNCPARCSSRRNFVRRPRVVSTFFSSSSSTMTSDTRPSERICCVTSLHMRSDNLSHIRWCCQRSEKRDSPAPARPIRKITVTMNNDQCRTGTPGSNLVDFAIIDPDRLNAATRPPAFPAVRKRRSRLLYSRLIGSTSLTVTSWAAIRIRSKRRSNSSSNDIRFSPNSLFPCLRRRQGMGAPTPIAASVDLA